MRDMTPAYHMKISKCGSGKTFQGSISGKAVQHHVFGTSANDVYAKASAWAAARGARISVL